MAPLNKSQAKTELEKLVLKFKNDLAQYKNVSYQEAQLRIDFLNEFLTVLGWDVANKQNLSPSYREVVTEDKVEVSGKLKAPDYSIRKTDGSRYFFIEAKKPNVNISQAKDPAFQLRRYGWSADLPISVLSSFEFFAVYDCSIRPSENDSATKARLKIIYFEDYLKEFDYIWDSFSKEAVLKGSLNQFKPKKAKKGTASVDKHFLEMLDEWRTKLAKNIHEENNLDEDGLNFTVQQIIDRIIFLRIAEDRNVEEYGSLKGVLNGKNHYKDLLEYFLIADKKYNSGLFKQSAVFEKLKVSNNVLAKIIEELYYPKSPYEFSVLPIEILGKAYEQFLGKKILVSDSGKIKIEEKPEVRKAGGVYYTPRYIVEYIVKNTVGKLCEGKTLEEVSKIRILDPASGSGSFLLYAYEFLLAWHKDYIAANQKKLSKKALTEMITPIGELTTKFKGKILLNNIYGVDIDANAVEVTKLSLLLKCMEGETKDTISAQRNLFQERILPTLDDNIKCGNSLIDFDIYTHFPDAAGDRKVSKKINAFNWKNSFKAVFSQGGFDAIIGNPPYIQSRDEQIFETEKDYFYKTFKTTEYQINTFSLFLEKIISLISENGKSGLIIPNYWLSTSNDKTLRQFLFLENHVEELVNVYKVFQDAIVDTAIILFRKASTKKQTHICSIDRSINEDAVKAESLLNRRWFYETQKEFSSSDEDVSISFQNTFELKAEKTLKNYFIFKFGAKLYEVGKGVPPQKKDDSKNKIYESQAKKGAAWLKLLRGKCIKHYGIKWGDDWVKYGDNLAAPRTRDLFSGSRILLQRIVSKPLLEAALTHDEFICTTDVITLKPINDIECKFFLAILNSKLCARYIKAKNINLDRAAFPKINTNTLEEFPVPAYEKVDKNTRKQIIQAVEKIEKIPVDTKNPSEKNERDFHEDKINEAVYKLYGLNTKEIAMIEGAINNG